MKYAVPELGGDYLGASLHKWLGTPLGAGILLFMLVRRGVRGAQDTFDFRPCEDGQWNCWGSDQPDRPVTALNVRSSRPINCSASCFSHS